MPRALLLAAVVLISPLTASAQQKTAKGPDLKALDAWITSAMTEWKIPGVAVGIVKDGKVVVAKGYGYRNLEEKLPVTEKTILAIGSNTKSFTVVLWASWSTRASSTGRSRSANTSPISGSTIRTSRAR